MDYLRRRHGRLREAKVMKAACGGGTSANRMTAAVAALLWLATAHGAARADLITYSFTGIDFSTGSPVTGSFSYNTSVPPSVIFQGVALYPDVGGSLSITDNGHTYTSTSVAANLGPNGLTLFSLPGTEVVGSTYVSLPWSGPGPFSVASLPATIAVNQLPFPTFAIGGGPAAPALGDGSITSVALQTSPSTAPEPGALTLAAIAATGALAVARRSRRGL
jgi:hypothetical protein